MPKKYFLALALSILLIGNCAFAIKETVKDSTPVTTINAEDIEQLPGQSVKDVLKTVPNVRVEENEKTDEEGCVVGFGYCENDEVFSQSNMAENKRNATTAIDVIYFEDIEEQGQPLAKDFLQFVPGVATNQVGSIGGAGNMRLRGKDKFAFMVDGLRINDPFDNTIGLNHFLSGDLDRIEVIRGPQGTISGNGAQAGAISLFTRRGRGPLTLEMDSGIGSFSTFREAVKLGAGNNDHDYFFSVTRLDTDGGSKIDGLKKTHRDKYGNTSIASNIGKRLFNGKAEIRNTFRFIDADKQIAHNGTPAVLDLDDSSHSNRIISSTSFSHAPTTWYDYNTRFGFNRERYFSSTGTHMDAFTFGEYEWTNNRFTLATQHNLKPSKFYTFQTGYNLETNHYDNLSNSAGSIYSIDKVNYENSVYFNNIINVNDILVVRAGVRILDNTDYGTYGMPNVSGAIILPTFGIDGAETKFRSSWGYAVNAPTLAQLYNPFYGFAGLTPEKSNGWEVGIDQSFWDGKVELSSTVFRNDYENLITYDFTIPNPKNPWGSGRYTNAGGATTAGLESSVRIAPCTWLDAQFNHTYTATDNGSGTDLIGVPRNMYNFILSLYPHERVTAYVKGAGTTSRNTFSGRVNGFMNASVGANVRVATIQRAELYVWGQINNLLNQKYDISLGYRNPGIHFTAGVKLKRPIGKVEKI